MTKSKLSNSSLKAVAEQFVEEGLIDRELLDPKNRHSAQDLLKSCLESYMETVVNGYRYALGEVQKRWGNTRLPEFMITDEMLEALNNSKEAGVVREKLHFLDDAIDTIFELAEDLKERRQWDEAISIYVFLIYLDPFISWFWHGLAECWQEVNQWQSAQFAYATAVNCDSTNPYFYQSLCSCLLEMGEREKAQTALQYGLKLLHEQPKSRDKKQAIDQLEEALIYVQSLTKRK